MYSMWVLVASANNRDRAATTDYYEEERKCAEQAIRHTLDRRWLPWGITACAGPGRKSGSGYGRTLSRGQYITRCSLSGDIIPASFHGQVRYCNSCCGNASQRLLISGFRDHECEYLELQSNHSSRSAQADYVAADAD